MPKRTYTFQHEPDLDLWTTKSMSPPQYFENFSEAMEALGDLITGDADHDDNCPPGSKLTVTAEWA